MADPSDLSRPPLYRAVQILDALPAASPPPLPVFDAIAVEESPRRTPPRLPERFAPRIGFLRRAYRGTASFLEWLFGVAALIVGLAVLAALPLLQFLSLGYLLEAGARVARTGRLRDGFVGVRLAARVGGIFLGSWLLLWPARFVADLARAAQVIDPGGDIARRWRFWLLVLLAATALHIGAACARGGRLRYFLWPFNVVWLLRRLFRGGYLAEARDAVWETTTALRLPYYFWLGLRGFVAALAWLVIPVTFLATGRLANPLAPLVGFFGGFLLAAVLLYLPFLQMRLAEVGRMSAAFDLLAVRRDFARAPWAFCLAFVVTLLSSLPLYVLKIEMMPRDAAWLASLVFIAFIFPVRLMTGWAIGRARRRDTPRHWFFRWTGRLPLLPAVAFYVVVVYFTQFTSWNGIWSLYEQHAFTLPVPFVGM